MSRPMNGAVEGMLAVLEDPAPQNADTAVAGPDRALPSRRARGPAPVQGPVPQDAHRPRSRGAAGGCLALSRTGDLDVVPDLIDALVDPEERVVAAAELGLQLLSRKIEGLGPPSPSTPEQRKEAAEKWRAWYDAIRPLEAEADDERRDPQGSPSRSAARSRAANPPEPFAMSPQLDVQTVR